MTLVLEEVSLSTYERFIADHHPRVFLPQTPEYVRSRQAKDSRIETVALRTATGQIRGVAAIYFQPWRRVFFRAHVTYGPLLDTNDDPQLLGQFAAQLEAYVKRDKRVLSLRINPLIARAFYRDIELVEENPHAKAADEVLKSAGFTRITEEFYQRSDVQIRFIYTKDIAHLDFEEALASLAKGLRRRFRAPARYGIEVRFVGPEQFGDFLSLYELTAERNDMSALSGSSITLYKDLMEEFDSDHSVLCIAYYSPQRHRDHIDQELAEIQARQREVSARKETKAQLRELADLATRTAGLETQRELAAQFEQLAGHSGDVPVNSALGYAIDDELLLLLGAMNKEYHPVLRDYPVEAALFKWAVEHNIATYNTFGISGVFDESAPDANILRFKQWLNGNVEEFIGSYEKVLHRNMGKLAGVEV